MNRVSQKQDEITNALNRHEALLLALVAENEVNRAMLSSLMATASNLSAIKALFQGEIEQSQQALLDNYFEAGYPPSAAQKLLSLVNKRKDRWVALLEQAAETRRRAGG